MQKYIINTAPISTSSANGGLQDPPPDPAGSADLFVDP